MKHILIALFSLFSVYVHAAPSVGYQAATNIAARVTSNVVTKAYVKWLGISGGGADTNAVNDLISSYVTTNAVTTNLTARIGDTATNVVSELLFAYDQSFVQKKRDYADMTASTNWNFKGWNEEGFYDPLYVVATNGIYGSTKWQLWSVINEEAVKLSEVDHGDKTDLEIRFENVGSMGFEVIARRCSYDEDDMLATVKTILHGTITPTEATNTAQNVIDANISTNNLCTVAAAQAMTNGTVSSALEIKNATGDVQIPRNYRFADNDGEGAGIGRLCLFQDDHEVQKCAWVSDVDYLSTIVAGKQDALSDVQVSAIGRISLYPASDEWMFNGTANSASKLHVTGAPLTYYDIQFFGNDELKWGRTNGGTHDYIAFHSDLSSFAPKLTGNTYDFSNGSNFTLRLYTALTNVIYTLGGSITNAPSFN